MIWIFKRTLRSNRAEGCVKLLALVFRQLLLPTDALPTWLTSTLYVSYLYWYTLRLHLLMRSRVAAWALVSGHGAILEQPLANCASDVSWTLVKYSKLWMLDTSRVCFTSFREKAMESLSMYVDGVAGVAPRRSSYGGSYRCEWWKRKFMTALSSSQAIHTIRTLRLKSKPETIYTNV